MSQPRVTLVHRHFNTLDDDVMRRRLVRLLRSVNWSIQAAARIMNIHRFTLYRIINSDEELSEKMKEARKSA